MADEPPRTDGLEAPADGNSEKQQAEISGYGPNNEKLPEDLQHELHSLVLSFETEHTAARRGEVKAIRKAREFWKGLQYLWWDDETQEWNLPFDFSIPTHQKNTRNEQVMPQFRFVTNIFRPYGLIIIAVLSQRMPKIKWQPQSAQQPEDVATAKTASKISDLVERNNRMQRKQGKLAWYLFCDGSAGAYTRYVADKARFGSKQMPILEERPQELSPAGYRCPNCGADTPETDTLAGICPQCGAGLGQENFMPAVSVPVPAVTGQTEVANGQEVIDYIGKLELKTPQNCEEMHE